VQRYLGEISEHGELSLVFLGGKFSHAVVKEAAPGEFRVQPQFGGTSRLVGTRRAIVRAAERILSCVGVPLLYARADGVEVGGELVLMELELVEPSLFLGMEERGFERMARAIRAGVTGIGGKRRA
jgi:hypothetical protein